MSRFADRTVVVTGTRGASSASPSAGGRMIQRSVSTWLRGMSRMKLETYSSAGGMLFYLVWGRKP